MARPGTGLAMPPPMTGMRTAMGTALGTAAGGAASFGGGLREGKFTEYIYGMIRDGKWDDAISPLSTKLYEFPTSRAAASLLAYCHYQTGDFQNAIQSYEQLMRLCPDVDSYTLYYAQSLFKAGLYEPAMKACQNVADSAELGGRVIMLQAAIKYEEGDLLDTKVLAAAASSPPPLLSNPSPRPFLAAGADRAVPAR